MIIYNIINKINGKMYIGQTVQKLGQRWYNHYNSKRDHCRALHNAIKKYGKENFFVEEITKCKSIEEMNYREVFYIKALNTLSPNGYNLKTGGGNSLPSEETKKRMSLSNKGKIRSIEQRKRVSDGRKGMKFSEGHKKNISISKCGQNHPNFGKHRSEETKRKLSELHKGKGGKFGIDNHFYGKHRTVETIMRLSGENNIKAKLNWDKVNQIRAIYRTRGFSQLKLAKMFCVSQTSIFNIVHNINWKTINLI